MNILPLDIVINVHGGLTYSASGLSGIDDSIFDELWWFGFDTCHSGDLQAFQYEFLNHDFLDKGFSISSDVYRNFSYVKEETISLAQQLSTF